MYSDQVAIRQSQVEKLYAGLKDLAGERRGKLEETFKLYTLRRDVDDLLQWIAEKSLVAGSNDPGHDYEHVSVSCLIGMTVLAYWLSRSDVDDAALSPLLAIALHTCLKGAILSLQDITGNLV